MKAFSNDVKICAIFQDKDLIRKKVLITNNLKNYQYFDIVLKRLTKY